VGRFSKGDRQASVQREMKGTAACLEREAYSFSYKKVQFLHFKGILELQVASLASHRCKNLLTYMNMCRIRALLLFTNRTTRRLAYVYFVRVCKNLASTKKHLAADFLSSSVFCIGSQYEIPFILPFSCSTVLNLGKIIF